MFALALPGRRGVGVMWGGGVGGWKVGVSLIDCLLAMAVFFSATGFGSSHKLQCRTVQCAPLRNGI